MIAASGEGLWNLIHGQILKPPLPICNPRDHFWFLGREFMARIRTIKPEFPQSESMGRVGRESRLCFIMLWTICDDAGRTRANSRMLASLLYPYDDDAPKKISGWLDELEREGCIRRYVVGADTYLECLNWLKHQKIDRPSTSRLPAFDECSRYVANNREASATDLVPGPVPSTKDQGPSTAIADSVDSPLPPWVPLDAWNGFVAMRRTVRAPLSSRAKSLAIGALCKLKDAGEDPEAVLDQSTQNSWKGLFPVDRRTARKANGSGRLLYASDSPMIDVSQVTMPEER